jgi:FkbM family methyltransferase
MIHDSLLEFAKSHASPTFCVIGANDGVTNDPVYPLAKRFRWRGLLVEPVPTYFRELQRAYKGLPVILEQVAVHRTERTMTLHYLDHGMMKLPAWARGVGSFDRSKIESLNEIPGREQALTQIEVPCSRLEELLQRSGLERVDVMVIDTEGYDAEVLRQVQFDAWQVKIVIFEHKLLSNADLTGCTTLLQQNGFRLENDSYDTLALREIP